MIYLPNILRLSGTKNEVFLTTRFFEQRVKINDVV